MDLRKSCFLAFSVKPGKKLIVKSEGSYFLKRINSFSISYYRKIKTRRFSVLDYFFNLNQKVLKK
jgi:hypothetical protein